MSTTVDPNKAAQDVLNKLRSSTTKKEDAEQIRFLTLLTTQLQNQDPMNPLQNAELTSQLAQMSTVDGIERLNKMFEQLLSSQNSSDSLQAAALVGHGVLVPGKNMVLTDAGGVGGFDLANGADNVTVSIKDASGVEVAQLKFDSLAAGSHNFVWDGTTLDGSTAAAGAYTMSISATKGGEEAKVDPLSFGLVTSVIRGASSTDLQVGALGVFTIDDIKQIL